MKLVGIDSGGTSCRVVVCDECGFVLQKCTVPGHNPNADGFDVLEESFREALTRALAPLGGLTAEIDAVFAGVAGGEGTNRQKLEEILSRLLPNAKALQVRSDALIALASGMGRRDGGVLIAGTGTVAFLRMGDNVRRFGGWGYLVDKGGSGWNIGRDGYLAAMAGTDAGLPETLLTRLYEAKLGMSMADSVTALYRDEFSLSACAPLVFEAAEQKDEQALRVLQENAAALVETISRMCRVFGKPCTIVLAGGLLKADSPYLELVREGIRERALPAELLIPRHPPIFGALCLASELAGLPEDEAFAENFNL